VKKSEVINTIFARAQLNLSQLPTKEKGTAYAPTNIALCKYWGKRNAELNLPLTSSLSIALPEKGAATSLSLHDEMVDQVILNGRELNGESGFVKRISEFLDLFRPEKKWRVKMDIQMNIPEAAGLASSACGFASLTAALDDLFAWRLDKRDLSIFARLGSGSAARSLWRGFVEWHAGNYADGMDSHAEPLAIEWPELYVGILTISNAPKPLSSREAMQRTIHTSKLYQQWPEIVAKDLVLLKEALQHQDFSLLGKTAESNALAMHATMLSSWPPICYSLPETIAMMQQIWQLRAEGLAIYFTQDAGPNLKLLFLEKDKAAVQQVFPAMEMIRVF